MRQRSEVTDMVVIKQRTKMGQWLILTSNRSTNPSSLVRLSQITTNSFPNSRYTSRLSTNIIISHRIFVQAAWSETLCTFGPSGVFIMSKLAGTHDNAARLQAESGSRSTSTPSSAIAYSRTSSLCTISRTCGLLLHASSHVSCSPLRGTQHLLILGPARGQGKATACTIGCVDEGRVGA
ncbi:hypothetical protein BC827DRAFT_1184172 [Russula dissimulans]|nr:hypothetical protein BC827DRAFT_1184172 [Russula dissimulans]